MTAILAEPALEVRPRQAADELFVTSALMKIPIGWVEPGPNVRGGDVGDVAELAVSIKATGQQEPIIVCQLDERRLQVIEGHRRRKAILLAGLSHVDAVLRRQPSERDRIIRQLAMHTHAKPFEPMAEARAVHVLFWTHKLSRDEIARRLGRGPTWVRDRLALLNLTDREQSAVANRELPLRDAMGAIRQRRAERDGHPAPRPPASPRPTRQIRDDHFAARHPLANAAGQRCTTAGHHTRPRLGGVACGACWEAAIRADQAAAASVAPAIGTEGQR
jgi:ParB family transcriptional regulator, chromosome partitioning protein